MKACRLHKIGEFFCDEIERPGPTGKQILIKVSACGVCGSDIPRIFAHGTSNGKYPLTLGHEFGGQIVEVGPEGDPGLIGQLGAVFPVIPCMECDQCAEEYYPMCEDYDYLGSRNDGGFAQYCLIPSEWNFVPVESGNEKKGAAPGVTGNPSKYHTDDFDTRLFAIVEPCTVAQHALRATGIDGRDDTQNVANTTGASQSDTNVTASARAAKVNNVVIFGAGPIGIMAARWARIFGATKVALIDVVDQKVEFANSLKEFCLNSTKEDFYVQLNQFFAGEKIDAIIEGTGFGQPLGTATELVKPHGTIVLMGNPAADTKIKLSQHSNILRKEINIKGIWNSCYSDKHINEWRVTLQHLADGSMEALDLISHEVTLDKLPQLCNDIYNKKVNICKAIAKMAL